MSLGKKYDQNINLHNNYEHTVYTYILLEYFSIHKSPIFIIDLLQKH